MEKTLRIHYESSPAERTELAGLLTAAFEAADAYQGAEPEYVRLLAQADAVDQFIRARDAGVQRKTAALRERFEQAVTTQAGQAATVSGLLERGVAHHAAHLAQRRQTAAVEMAVPYVLVRTDPARGGFTPGDGMGEVKEPEFPPRLAWLRAYLPTIGIFEDDLIIQYGRTDPSMMRQEPYILIDIPRFDVQIALCEQVGEATFVKRGIMPAAYWASYTKEELVEKCSAVRVVCYDEPQWLGEIAALIEKLENAPKVDVLEIVRMKPKNFPLTEEFILHHAKLHFEKHSELPIVKSGKVDGVLHETWSAWNSALGRSKPRRGVGPELSLNKLYEKAGWRAGKLTPELILRHGQLYLERHGNLPTAQSGIVEGFLDETWAAWQTALLAGKRGLDSSRLTLISLFIQGGLRSAKLELTPEVIIHHANLFREKNNGVLPCVLSGSVDNLSDETWIAWNTALANGTRGFPGGSSLQDLFIKYGLKKEKVKFTKELIAEKAWQYFEKNNKFPNENSGPVDGLPNETWERFNNSLMQGIRGIESGGSSLKKLYVEHGWRLGNLTEDLIANLVWKHYQRHRQFPTGGTGRVDDLPDETWMAFTLALGGSRGKSSRGVGPGMSLLKLINKYHLPEKAAAVEAGWLALEDVDLLAQTAPIRGVKKMDMTGLAPR